MGAIQYVKPKSSRRDGKRKGNRAKGTAEAVNSVLNLSFALGSVPSDPLEGRQMYRCIPM
jgi:hypothetical protein